MCCFLFDGGLLFSHLKNHRRPNTDNWPPTTTKVWTSSIKVHAKVIVVNRKGNIIPLDYIPPCYCKWFYFLRCIDWYCTVYYDTPYNFVWIASCSCRATSGASVPIMMAAYSVLSMLGRGVCSCLYSLDSENSNNCLLFQRSLMFLAK